MHAAGWLNDCPENCQLAVFLSREDEQDLAVEEAQWRERQRARELLLLKSPGGRRRRLVSETQREPAGPAELPALAWPPWAFRERFRCHSCGHVSGKVRARLAGLHSKMAVF
jgi:hypothetical protein